MESGWDDIIFFSSPGVRHGVSRAFLFSIFPALYDHRTAEFVFPFF
jgi:hypothetical protein